MAFSYAGDWKFGADAVVDVHAVSRNVRFFCERGAFYAGLPVLSRLVSGVFYHFLAAS